MPEDGLAGLSLESRIELCQKIDVVPPPAKKTERPGHHSKGFKPPKTPLPHSVQTTDNCGRMCTGTLHGPLLMEDAGISTPSAAAFSSEGFRYDNVLDFDNLRDASKALALFSSPDELGHAQDPGFMYVGTIDGRANLVKDDPELAPESIGVGAVIMPDGRIGHVSRSPRNGGEIRVRVPEESLDMLVNWGRRLLAIA